MLGWRESSECSVKYSSCPGYLLLLGEELTVVHPHPGHLVHKDEAPLEAVVDLVVSWICDTTTLDLFPAHLENK